MGVYDGETGRRFGVRSGDDGGMARPVGVYENAVGALFMAGFRYCDMGIPPGREASCTAATSTGDETTGAARMRWVEATTATREWRGPGGVGAG
ncbi:hypothetical protein GCM10009832_13380 [Dietzia kunjamensis subsp. schimae]